MPFQIIRNDITRVKADAIVNTANPHPRIGRGTDGAVYHAAGARELLAERKKIGDIPVGEVAVTAAFSLPANYIIHTVGPVWKDGSCGEFDQLASCYRKSLLIADQLGCESIAFPLISTGTYGFPKDKALQIALHTISEYLKNSEINVLLVVFDRKAFEISSALSEDVRQYIDDNYVFAKEKEYDRVDYRTGSDLPAASENCVRQDEEREEAKRPKNSLFSRIRRRKQQETDLQAPMPAMQSVRPPKADTGALPVGEIQKAEAEKKLWFERNGSLDDVLRNAGEGFQERLFRLIDERNLDDPEVYRKANISRKLFSKIRCNADYTPGKRTVLALAVALELNLDQTVDLLSRAGLAFSPGNIFDLIVRYCIERQTYDIFEINALLFEYDQPLLGNAAAD